MTEAFVPTTPTLEAVADSWNLFEAYRRARRGKRDRSEVAAFELRLEEEIFRLRRDLLEESWRPGGYRTFWVRDPVLRRISAAPFRDRVVQQALCHVLEPTFESFFTPTSFACRRGKGTHRALRAASSWARRYPWVLHADIRKFFPSIDHAVLTQSLEDAVEDPRLMRLCARIVDGSNPQDEVIEYFPGDTLFAPYERRRGLPIGNLTSQWFANLILTPLDRWAASGNRAYIRYMDDILVFERDPDLLHDARARIERVLVPLRLRLHGAKTRVLPTRDGFAFLGFRVFPQRRLILAGNVRRARRRFRRLRTAYARGALGIRDVSRSVEAWVAHARFGDTYRLRTRIFRDLVFARETVPGR